MTTNNKQVKAKINAYILSCINTEGYGVECSTDIEKLQFLADTFKREYCYPYNFKRYKSVQDILREWVRDTPSSFNVDFSYMDILKAAKTFGNLPDKMTIQQEGKIICNWFNFIACHTLRLMNKNGIPTSFFFN